MWSPKCTSPHFPPCTVAASSAMLVPSCAESFTRPSNFFPESKVHFLVSINSITKQYTAFKTLYIFHIAHPLMGYILKIKTDLYSKNIRHIFPKHISNTTIKKKMTHCFSFKTK
jgi:hypothetical protein